MASHSFNPEFACVYGIVEAVLIQHFQYWIKKNRDNKVNNREERTWTYNSVTKLCDIFAYLTRKQVRSALENLTDKGVLLKRRYNKTGYDRTNWYCFAQEEKFIENNEPVTQAAESQPPLPFALQGKCTGPTGQMDLPSEAIRFAPQGQPIPYILHSSTDEDDVAIAEKIIIKKPAIPPTIDERKRWFKEKVDSYRCRHSQLYPISIYVKFYDWWTQPSNSNNAVMRHEAERDFDVELRLQNFWKTISEADRKVYWSIHEDWMFENKQKNNVKSIITHITRNTQPELFGYQRTS